MTGDDSGTQPRNPDEPPVAGQPSDPPPDPPVGLDPDAAIAARRRTAPTPALPAPPPRPKIDTRRYQWMIGGFGVFLLIVFSVVLYAHGGGGASDGIPAGQPLHRFVAPLATSDLDLAANLHPRCDPARPARRGLNVCGREPIVLALFATSGPPCVNEVTTLDAIAPRFPAVQFAAVAVNADRAATAALVRRHHWTVPVAFDVTGGVGQVYGVNVCPIVEIARTGGIVARRLIGQAWERPDRLAAVVAASLGTTPR